MAMQDDQQDSLAYIPVRISIRSNNQTIYYRFSYRKTHRRNTINVHVPIFCDFRTVSYFQITKRHRYWHNINCEY